MNAQADEIDLVTKAQGGCRDALNDLVERARARMFPVAYGELRHHEDAQDAVGSALLQVCLHIHALRDPERFRPWICSIVRNESRRLVRSRGPETTEGEMDDREAPTPALPSSLLRIDIERALYRLPWDEARAVALFYLKGESIRQIALYLGRPEGTIKRWLHLGRQQLARELEDYRPQSGAARCPGAAAPLRMPQQLALMSAFDTARRRVYAANEGGLLTVLGSDSSEVIASIPVGENITAVALDSRMNRIYVSHFPTAVERFSGHLSVVDGGSLQVAAVIEIGNTPRALAVNPITDRVYVACAGDNRIDIVDAGSERAINHIPVGSVPLAVAIDPLRGKLYVANWGSWTVSVIDLTTETVTGEIAVGAFPADAVVNPTTGSLYVANSEARSISVIDEPSRCVVKTIRVGSRPVRLTVNTGRNEIHVTRGGVRKSLGRGDIIDGATDRLIKGKERR